MFAAFRTRELKPGSPLPEYGAGEGHSLGVAAPRAGLPRPYRLVWRPVGLYGRWFKRAIDVLLVVASLPVVLPLVGVLALLIWAEGGQPFFGQPRIGRAGRRFRMWKLRSMRVGAEEMLAHYLARDPALRAEWDATQKLRNDPRITPLGRFIRKTSLDELPQLWNVLKGDMSLVGPRPFLPEQMPLYPGGAYYLMRPGLTGYWQVADRNECDFIERAGHDNRYFEALSLATDLRLILKTFRVVWNGTGC